MTSFKDRVAIVTGGGAGIGHAVALRLAEAGARVLITGRRAEATMAAAAAHPSIAGFVAEVGELTAGDDTVAEAIRLWGRVDVLVNNAGAGKPEPLSEASMSGMVSAFRTNFAGPTLMAKAALPELVRNRGAIVNLSSTLARKPIPAFGTYGGLKAGLEQLTRTWAVELAPSGVRVNAVSSGPVESDFLKERMGFSDEQVAAIKEQETSLIPLGRRGVAGDVARWVVALCDPSADWVTGQILGVDGGFSL